MKQKNIYNGQQKARRFLTLFLTIAFAATVFCLTAFADPSSSSSGTPSSSTSSDMPSPGESVDDPDVSSSSSSEAVPSSSPVSYTHLDVYKRQQQRNPL